MENLHKRVEYMGRCRGFESKANAVTVCGNSVPGVCSKENQTSQALKVTDM